MSAFHGKCFATVIVPAKEQLYPSVQLDHYEVKIKSEKNMLTDEKRDGSKLRKGVMSLGFSVWNVWKYSPHCNKMVKVTTPQSDTCTVFCLQFRKQVLDATDSFGSLY